MDDPFQALRQQFQQSGVGFEELGTEQNPDGGDAFFVASMPEQEFDDAATIAEEQGVSEIMTEPSPVDDDILARFRR